MHAMQGAFKVFLQFGKITVEGGQTRHDDIIVIGLGQRVADFDQRGFEPAADPVANNRTAEFFRDREPETRFRPPRGLCLPAATRL